MTMLTLLIGISFRHIAQQVKKNLIEVTWDYRSSGSLLLKKTVFSLFLKLKRGAWLWLDEIDNEELDENTYVLVIR